MSESLNFIFKFPEEYNVTIRVPMILKNHI